MEIKKYRLKVLILLFISLSGKFIYAQKYKVEYLQIINYNDKPDSTVATLIFDNNESVYSLGKNSQKKIIKDLPNRDDNSKEFKVRLGDEKGLIYYKRYKNLYFITREIMFTKPVIITDSIAPINWEIDTLNTKTIGDLKCKRAVGDFRGRTYVVWFAEEIPVNTGPWKLWGLPGLIVEVQDTYRVLTVQLKSIKVTSENIEIPDGEEKITQDEYVKQIKQKLKNLANFLKTSGSKEEGFETKTKIKINVLEKSLF